MSTKKNGFTLNIQAVKNLKVRGKVASGALLATAILACALMLLNGRPPVNGPPPRSDIALARIRLISLKCVKTEDWMGRDETYLTVKGARVWGHSMNDGETQSLGGVPSFPFTGEVHVALYDGDAGWGDDDDLLGVTFASAQDRGKGPVTSSFTGDDAHYILTYEIVP